MKVYIATENYWDGEAFLGASLNRETLEQKCKDSIRLHNNIQELLDQEKLVRNRLETLKSGLKTFIYAGSIYKVEIKETEYELESELLSLGTKILNARTELEKYGRDFYYAEINSYELLE